MDVLTRGSVPGPLLFFRFIIRAVDEKEDACVGAGVGARRIEALGRRAGAMGYFEALVGRSMERKAERFIVGGNGAWMWRDGVAIDIWKSRGLPRRQGCAEAWVGR